MALRVRTKLMYQTSFFQLLDDLAIVEDKVAVTEITLFGFGPNQIVYLDKDASWWSPREVENTGEVQLSSLVYDQNGVLGSAGSVIATSWFQGGIYEY